MNSILKFLGVDSGFGNNNNSCYLELDSYGFKLCINNIFFIYHKKIRRKIS